MERDEVLRLDKIYCALINSIDEPAKKTKSHSFWTKHKLAEQMERTLVFSSSTYEHDDSYVLGVYRKKPLCDIPVIFCGIQRSSRTCMKKGGGMDVIEYISLIFTTLAVVIDLHKDRMKANESYSYYLKACKDKFGHIVSTKTVTRKSYPRDNTALKGKSEVLLSVTRSRMSLCDKAEPHQCLVSWSLGQLHTVQGNNELQLHVSEKGKYRFQSDSANFTEIHSHIQAHKLAGHSVTAHDDSESQCHTPTTKAGLYMNTSRELPSVPESIYLRPIDLIDIKKHVDEPVYMNSVCRRCIMTYQPYYEDIYDEIERPYSLDLNEYVKENHQIYDFILNGSLENISSDTYLVTCASELYYNTKYEQQKHGAPSDVGEGIYLTTCDDNTKYEKLERRLYSCSINSPDDAWCIPISNQQESSLSPCPDMALASSNEYTQIGACAAQTATEKSSYGTSSSVILPCVEQLNGDNGRPFSHSSDHYEIEIIETLNGVLRRKPPSYDTLHLTLQVRSQLCMRLYLPSCNTAGTFLEDWQLLGETIGLCVDAINLISAIIKNHFLPYPAAEVVLRHWQYMYNKYGATDVDGNCPYACNQENLVNILRDMNRHDLVELVIPGR